MRLPTEPVLSLLLALALDYRGAVIATLIFLCVACVSTGHVVIILVISATTTATFTFTTTTNTNTTPHPPNRKGLVPPHLAVMQERDDIASVDGNEKQHAAGAQHSCSLAEVLSNVPGAAARDEAVKASLVEEDVKGAVREREGARVGNDKAQRPFIWIGAGGAVGNSIGGSVGTSVSPSVGTSNTSSSSSSSSSSTASNPFPPHPHNLRPQLLHTKLLRKLDGLLTKVTASDLKSVSREVKEVRRRPAADVQDFEVARPQARF